MMKIAAFALLVAMIGLTEAKMQNVKVKGIAVCNKLRVSDVVVELWEKDTLDPNDQLAKTKTNKNGEFFLEGGDDEITSIAPYIIIRHTCKVVSPPGKNCTRNTEYVIPKNYIDNPQHYDMTFVTLDIFTPGEKEQCEKLKNPK